jgi:hypothetical protein
MKLILLSTLCNVLAVQGFLPSSSIGTKTGTVSPTALFTEGKQQEKELREELAQRASVVEDEEKYSLRDGPGVIPPVFEEATVDVPATASDGETAAETLTRRMEKLKRRRAYPLFLAEKGLEIVESFFPGDAIPPPKRERIVVLGTGWGAVSFLKTIDTNLYDVTVISPRNYFLFTPMLGMQLILVAMCIWTKQNHFSYREVFLDFSRR